SGDLPDFEHHFVGDLAQHEPVIAALPIPLDVYWPADGDRTVHAHLRQLGVRRLDLVGADDANGKDLAAHLQGKSSCPCLSFVEIAIPTARSLREDAEELASAEHLARGLERALARLTSGPIDRDHAERWEQVARLPRIHVLGLADEADPAWHRRHQED